MIIRSCTENDTSLILNLIKDLGAKQMDEWTVFRLDEAGINNLANEH